MHSMFFYMSLVSFAVKRYAVIFLRNALQNSGQQQGSQNKQGNPLEFLQLLASLTKRW